MIIFIFLFSVLTSLLGGSPAHSFDERFPTEINSHIIGNCSALTVVRVSRTCHYLQELCSNETLWKDFCHGDFPWDPIFTPKDKSHRYYHQWDLSNSYPKPVWRKRLEDQLPLNLRKNVDDETCSWGRHYAYTYKNIYLKEQERVTKIIRSFLNLDEESYDVDDSLENEETPDSLLIYDPNRLNEMILEFFNSSAIINHDHDHSNEKPEPEEEKISELNLSYGSIFSLPILIWDQLSFLSTLNLSCNQLYTIPGELSVLQSLTWLDVSRNHLTRLPEELFSLANLEVLSLENNKIGKISKNIKNLKKLEKLDLSYNKICSLPYEIVYLPLKILSLHNNPLKNLPLLLKMYGPNEYRASLNIMCTPHDVLKNSLFFLLSGVQRKFHLHICFGQKNFLMEHRLFDVYKKRFICEEFGFCSCGDESK